MRPTRSQQPGKSAAAAGNFQDALVLDRPEILEHQPIPRTGFVRMGRRGIEHFLVPLVVSRGETHGWVFGRAWPPLGLRRSRTCASNRRTRSGVRSVEPSSTTRISRSAAGKSCSSTLVMACSMNRSWLYVSISTVTYGRVIGVVNISDKPLPQPSAVQQSRSPRRVTQAAASDGAQLGRGTIQSTVARKVVQTRRAHTRFGPAPSRGKEPSGVSFQMTE